MDDSLETMLNDGSLEQDGFDEHGQPLYRVVPEVCRVLHPRVYNEQYGNFLGMVNELWQDGYLDLTFEDDDITIHLNSKSKSPGNDLTDELKHTLSEIVLALSQ